MAQKDFHLTNGQSLEERISALSLQTPSTNIPATDDKWVLASNLQKAIRRGLPQVAVGTVNKLLRIDSSYCWRRLVVISYEDVGFGDISLCHELLKTFRREALHRQLGTERVAGYFAHELARTPKSRALCDAIAMLEFSVQRARYERQCLALEDNQLLDIAGDCNAAVMDRTAALRHIAGYREAGYRNYRLATPPRPDLMREIVSRLELNEIEGRLYISGQGVSESMNIALPVIAQMIRGAAPQEQHAEHAFCGKNGILYAALDTHTRAGKRCFRVLAKEDKPLREFFGRRPALDPVAVLGAGVFIVEGTALGRWLIFGGTDDLRQMFNRHFLEYVGVTEEEQDELLVLIKDSLPRLNYVRDGEIG